MNRSLGSKRLFQIIAPTFQLSFQEIGVYPFLLLEKPRPFRISFPGSGRADFPWHPLLGFKSYQHKAISKRLFQRTKKTPLLSQVNCQCEDMVSKQKYGQKSGYFRVDQSKAFLSSSSIIVVALFKVRRLHNRSSQSSRYWPSKWRTFLSIFNNSI